MAENIKRLFSNGAVHFLRPLSFIHTCYFMEYEVVGSRPRGRPKRTWLEVVQRDCQVRGLSKDDAMVRGRWRMIRMVDEQEGCEWMDVSSGTGSPG